ncbi:nucleoside ABC transporter membrane protein [Labedella gwakjiensis]|uniref:ABC transporter permease n=1 Tax=Labedella gwakjiensis TaxID=390269 RepID=A0A2P8GWT2_9MICO|nr:ABC transporter permease [Labedella gwakjiensis]PSL38412.1 nucleoside ABC transporter membrane protein [Labedella gwakjiensis]RUQ87063.1 ABC transporter permease [Labedella gwakjiensis]
MTTTPRHSAPVAAPPTDPRQSPVRRALVATGRTLQYAGLPVGIALVVGAIVLAATGNDPLAVYGRLASEAFGTPSRINATLAATTPILFTAVAAAFAYRAGVFTVGVEGSFVLGGLTAAVIGARMEGVPPVVSVLLPLLGATVAGVLVAAVPAVLRALWGVDEVVTTLMFNFIVAGVAGWSVQAFFQERGQANSATAYVSANAELPALAPPGQTSWGLVIALLLLVGYAVWMRFTTIGFEFRAVGSAPRFSAAQGLRVRTVLLIALLGAGLIGGIGGGAHALGLVHRYTEGFSAGFGFTGIAIALLARFNPIGILVGAILFGALNAAGATVQLFIDLPVQLIDILEGTVMVFAVAVFTLPRLARRRAAAKRGDA